VSRDLHGLVGDIRDGTRPSAGMPARISATSSARDRIRSRMAPTAMLLTAPYILWMVWYGASLCSLMNPARSCPAGMQNLAGF
jgi:hypothetical protein